MLPKSYTGRGIIAALCVLAVAAIVFAIVSRVRDTGGDDQLGEGQQADAQQDGSQHNSPPVGPVDTKPVTSAQLTIAYAYNPRGELVLPMNEPELAPFETVYTQRKDTDMWSTNDDTPMYFQILDDGTVAFGRTIDCLVGDFNCNDYGGTGVFAVPFENNGQRPQRTVIRDYVNSPQWDSAEPVHGYMAIRAGEALLFRDRICMFVEFFPSSSSGDSYLLFLEIVIDDQSNPP
jgi:hypothetical protein